MTVLPPTEVPTIQADLARAHELNRAADLAKQQSIDAALMSRDHLLTGFATLAIQYARESVDHEARAKDLRAQASEVTA